MATTIQQMSALQGSSQSAGATQPQHVLVVDGTGAAVSFGGSGGTSQTDRSGFTEGSGTFTPAGGVVNDTVAAAVTENQAAAVRITPQQAFHVNLRANDGTELSAGAGVQYTEGDTDSTITGTAMLWEDGSDTLRSVSAAKPLPIGDAGGNLSIDDGGNSITVDYATTGSGNATGALRVELANNGTGVLATVGAVTAITNALPAGANAIGKLAANSGVTIGAVEIAAAQTLATVTTVSTVTAVTTLTGSGIAHDGVDSGNPHKIGARAVASPKGLTLVSAADRSDLLCDLDGIMLVKNGTAWGDLISERVSNTDGASTAFSTFDNAAGTHNYITQITVHNAHATTNGYVDIRDGTAGSIIWTIPLPATGGATIHFNPPLRQPTAATALAFDVSAAITTVYLSVNGFKSKV